MVKWISYISVYQLDYSMSFITFNDGQSTVTPMEMLENLAGYSWQSASYCSSTDLIMSWAEYSTPFCIVLLKYYHA